MQEEASEGPDPVSAPGFQSGILGASSYGGDGCHSSHWGGHGGGHGGGAGFGQGQGGYSHSHGGLRFAIADPAGAPPGGGGGASASAGLPALMIGLLSSMQELGLVGGGGGNGPAGPAGSDGPGDEGLTAEERMLMHMASDFFEDVEEDEDWEDDEDGHGQIEYRCALGGGGGGEVRAGGYGGRGEGEGWEGEASRGQGMGRLCRRPSPPIRTPHAWACGHLVARVSSGPMCQLGSWPKKIVFSAKCFTQLGPNLKGGADGKARS